MAYNNSDQASTETAVSITGIVTLSSDPNQQPAFGTLKNTKTYEVTIDYSKGRVKTITVADKVNNNGGQNP